MIDDALFWHRLHFAFTIVFHYLFQQLTMGIAWFLVGWKWLHLWTGDRRYGDAARLWARIFGIDFGVGVVTGIPMEFQFGTNWAGFSKYAGVVVGQTLAMEGMFAFFLESETARVERLGVIHPLADGFGSIGARHFSWCFEIPRGHNPGRHHLVNGLGGAFTISSTAWGCFWRC